MSSFSCPHLDEARGYCLRLEEDCVPGRAGCVLRKNSAFFVPAEQRLGQGEPGQGGLTKEEGPAKPGMEG